MYLYEYENNIWTELNINLGIPKWNHNCLIIPSLPNNKIFIFGGSSGYFEEGAPRNFGNVNNKVIYFDLLENMDNN